MNGLIVAVFSCVLGRFKRFLSFDRWKNNGNKVIHLCFYILDQLNSHRKSYKSHPKLGRLCLDLTSLTDYFDLFKSQCKY